MTEPKQDRVDKANQLIEAIAGCGRKFFNHSGNISRFELDFRGRVWFIDGYSGKRIYTHHQRPWSGFTNGGTMERLVRALVYFITSGDTIPPGHLGPWPQWVCDGDLWGYGNDMATVRQKAQELGIIPASEKIK